MSNKILVVDDEESLRMLFQAEFEETGYQVKTAATAEEALAIIPDYQPNLVIMDIRMPGMSGLEALAKIKEMERDLPVIICSAYGEYKQDFSSWASDGYVIKSTNLDELKRQVKKFLPLPVTPEN